MEGSGEGGPISCQGWGRGFESLRPLQNARVQHIEDASAGRGKRRARYARIGLASAGLGTRCTKSATHHDRFRFIAQRPDGADDGGVAVTKLP